MTHAKKLDQIKDTLLSELRANICLEKNHIANTDYQAGKRVILRYMLENFFMTREEVGIVINETWESA